MVLRLALGIAIVLSSIFVPAATAAARCAATGAEWPMNGGGFDNARNQWAEEVLNPGTVANIQPAWMFDAEVAQLGGGTFSNTPVVADGCVYLGSSTGFVFALNEKNGKLVWASKKLPGSPAGALVGGVITGSPVVANGKVYVAVSRASDPFIGVLDQDTGKIIGTWPVLPKNQRGDKNKHRNTIIASPVVWNGLLFQGIMADEASDVARGGYSILDAKTGEILVHRWVINNAEYKAGHRGASLWCTAALDTSTGYVYACGGNPASKRIEHRYSNALLKIDLRQRRGGVRNPNFGRIVDSYKGEVDQYYPGLDRQPVCELLGEDLVVVWSQACLQLDLDFGASPHLYKDSLGRTIVGDLQKSGIYHAAFADQMQRNWTAVVGNPLFTNNAASPAYDKQHVYTAAVQPGQVVALRKDDGRYVWAAPLAGVTQFQPVSVANGVVYVMDNYGFLNAFDAETGLPLMKRPIGIDGGDNAADLSSQGVSIANGTVFAASGRFVVAYR